jgi:hypothetical protein
MHLRIASEYEAAMACMNSEYSVTWEVFSSASLCWAWHVHVHSQPGTIDPNSALDPNCSGSISMMAVNVLSCLARRPWMKGNNRRHHLWTRCCARWTERSRCLFASSKLAAACLLRENLWLPALPSQSLGAVHPEPTRRHFGFHVREEPGGHDSLQPGLWLGFAMRLGVQYRTVPYSIL